MMHVAQTVNLSKRRDQAGLWRNVRAEAAEAKLAEAQAECARLRKECDNRAPVNYWKNEAAEAEKKAEVAERERDAEIAEGNDRAEALERMLGESQRKIWQLQTRADAADAGEATSAALEVVNAAAIFIDYANDTEAYGPTPFTVADASIARRMADLEAAIEVWRAGGGVREVGNGG